VRRACSGSSAETRGSIGGGKSAQMRSRELVRSRGERSAPFIEETYEFHVKLVKLRE